MTESHPKIRIKPPRIHLTDPMQAGLKEKYAGASLPLLARKLGLPYGLVYNIFNQRVATISASHYRRIFDDTPPRQPFMQVDGTYFRSMVNLWLYLNEDDSKSNLYREFYPHRDVRKTDYRIFTGKTASVDARSVRRMETKFRDCSLDPKTLGQWIVEHEQQNQVERHPYANLRPMLKFMKDALGVHPTSLLNQFADRYEKGDLRTVSPKIYQRVSRLTHRAEEALDAGDMLAVERIKEEIYGGKKGYTLYAEIREPLRFLQRYARKSPKRYLGRGTYMYEKGGCKRIPTWRAVKILEDCDGFIRSNLELPINGLPKLYRRQWLDGLFSVLLDRAADLLSRADGIALEKKILSPAHEKDRYIRHDDGFIQFDRAPSSLGMRKAAFDLMVAKNCDIFRGVGRYARRWYVSDLYLKELAGNPHFNLITAKYERLAMTMTGRKPSNQCLY